MMQDYRLVPETGNLLFDKVNEKLKIKRKRKKSRLAAAFELENGRRRTEWTGATQNPNTRIDFIHNR